MKITILNGDTEKSGSNFSTYVDSLAQELKKTHTVDVFALEKMNIHYCTGCWSCWWKTPGLCRLNDEGEAIFKSVIHSDFLIFASPLVAGFISAELKKISDRLIVLIHPYIEIREGENHHKKRYEKYPEFGVILKKEADTDAEDLEIIKDIYDRFAINFHTKQRYLKIAEQDKMEDIIHETSRI